MSRSGRHRIRDPRAGILADWFGLSNYEACMLVALHDKPGTKHDLGRRLGIPANNVGHRIARLRQAGLPIPHGHKEWEPFTYKLSPEAHRQVCEAYQHAGSLLVPMLLEKAEERIAALEEALGMTLEDGVDLGLSRTESQVYGMLAKGKLVHRERIMLALYGFRDDAPDTKIVDVMICHMRPKLKRHGIGIVAVRGEGFKLVDERPVRTAA